MFTNTGICNSDGSIVHSQTLEDTYFHWQYRNSIAGEGTVEGNGFDWNGRRGWGTPQNCRWGKNTMNDVIGEDPDNPVTESTYAEMGEMSIDEFDDNGNIMRAYYSWHGRHSTLSYDNLGSPNYQGLWPDGLLGASQFAGSVVLHVDTSPTNSADDIYQPTTSQMIESNDQATVNNDQYSSVRMEAEYLNFLSAGHSELSHAEAVRAANTFPDLFAEAGGYSQSWAFGPYTLAPGDSIRIVIAEAVGGLDRTMNYEIGNNWFRTMMGETPELVMPDGSITTDPNDYKNAWVYSGRDSLMQTFRRAIQAWDMGLANVPAPPPPPTAFSAISAMDYITLSWDNSAEAYTHFAGYRLYRAPNDFNQIYEKIFECGPGTDHLEIVNTWDDVSANPVMEYFYYLVSIDDGSQNIIHSGIPLESSKFMTLTAVPIMRLDHPVINADVYVNPSGSDDNSGLRADDPFKTITWASEMMISSPLQLNTIHLAPGTYSPSSTGEIFPLVLKNFFIVRGDSLDRAILDAEGSAGVLFLDNLVDVKLQNLVITNGISVQGGGIECLSSSAQFSNLLIESNSGSMGGGLFCGIGSVLDLNHVTLRDNFATIGGGYCKLSGAQILLSETQRCNIYQNVANFIGYDIYEFGQDNTFLTVDTFSVMTPSDYHAYGFQFETDILNAKTTQIRADLYVSPSGNNTNTGLSPDQAFKTIEMAIASVYADDSNHQTIYLGAGTYSYAETLEKFPIQTRSFVSIVGDSPQTTILDADSLDRVVNINGDSQLTLENMKLINGMALGYTGGGGLSCNGSTDLSLSNLNIARNQGSRGGGISFRSNTGLTLAGVTVHHNQAETGGGGLYIFESDLTFSPTNRCNIYLNESAEGGSDLHSMNLFEYFDHTIVVDTFTVLFPIEEYASPLNDFTFDILNSIILQAEADLYVSPTGNNSNTGLTVEDPLKTLTYALELVFADETRPHTINLLEGVLSATSNGEVFPVQMRSYVSIAGHPDGGSVLDAEHLGQGLICDNVTDLTISNLTVRGGSADNGAGIYCNESIDITLVDLILHDNRVSSKGGGVYAENSNLQIENSVFNHNRAKYGAGIATLNSYLNVTGSIFYDDSSKYGAALYLKESNSQLDRLTIANNEVSSRGAAITLWGSGASTLSNSIGWNNEELSLYLRSGTSLSVEYSDIQDGLETVSGDSIYWLDGNIDLDPLFCHPVGANYHLAENSPCVAAGENGENMGALEVGCTVTVDDYALLPTEHTLYQNFPNPFNPITTIRYGLMENARVNLVIYDITGRTVVSLEDREQVAGWYDLTWNGIDQVGHPMSTGVYFCRLQVKDLAQCGTGDYSKTIKMIYLK